MSQWAKKPWPGPSASLARGVHLGTFAGFSAEAFAPVGLKFLRGREVVIRSLQGPFPTQTVL